MGLKDGAKAVAGKAVSLPKATVVGFWKGLAYPFKGAKLVFFQHPKLARFWIVPILITVVLLTGALWGGWAAHESVTDWIWADPADAANALKAIATESLKDKPRDKLLVLATEPGFWAEAGHWAHSALEVLILLVLWTVGILAVVMLTNVVAAPFNDFLSEEVERIVTGKQGPPFSLKVILRDTVRTVGLEILKLVIYAMIMIPLFLLAQLLPAVGHVIYSVFAFLFTALYFAVDYLDWPASRRNRSVTYRFGLLTDHFMPMFGFGTGVWLFLFIPLVNLLFMPAAVAGGTLLFLDVEGRALGPDAAADATSEQSG